MKSKRIFVLSLIATLLLIFTLSASAAEAAAAIDLSFTLEPSSSYVETGKDFTVALNIDKNTKFKAAILTVTYDATKLTFNGCDATGSVCDEVSAEADEGIIKIEIGNGLVAVFGDAPVIEKTGKVTTLKFTAAENTEAFTKISLELDPKNVIDENKKGNALKVVENVDTEISIFKANHTHQEVVDKGYDATCTTKGLTDGKHCKLCGVVTVAQKEIGELKHPEASQETLKAVDPTCTEKGKTEGKKCKLCGEVVVAQKDVDELKHPEASCEVLAAVAATCKDTGLTEGKKCKLCNEVLVAQNVVPALNHPSSSIKVIAAVDATCTTEGSTAGMTCTLCNEVLAAPETVAAKGHKYSEWKVTKEATKKEAGSENCTCANCGDVQVRAIAKLEGCGSAVIGMPIVLCVATVFGATMACKKKED